MRKYEKNGKHPLWKMWVFSKLLDAVAEFWSLAAGNAVWLKMTIFENTTRLCMNRGASGPYSSQAVLKCWYYKDTDLERRTISVF